VLVLVVVLALCAERCSAHNCIAVNVPARMEMIHGTPVKPFIHRDTRAHTNYPTGPSWFTPRLYLAMQAGGRLIRVEGTKLRFYYYRTNRILQFIQCNDSPEMYKAGGYMVTNNIFNAHNSATDDAPAARAYCLHPPAAGPHGYVILHDVVRAEPEYVFCNPEANLRFVKRKKTTPFRFVGSEKHFSMGLSDYQLTQMFLYKVHWEVFGGNSEVLMETMGASARSVRATLLNKHKQKQLLQQLDTAAAATSSSSIDLKQIESGCEPFWDAESVEARAKTLKNFETPESRLAALIKAHEKNNLKEVFDHEDEEDSEKWGAKDTQDTEDK
jgi:uncharacterized membrane protein